MISLLEELGNKLQQTNSTFQDDLKDQVNDIKSTICSAMIANQESHHKAQLLAAKKSNALLHELLDKLSNLTSAVEELKNENKSLAQQLKNRSVVTQGGSPTPPSSVKDKNISNSDLTAAHEIANASNPAPETQDTPSKDKGPNLHDPTSPDFNPNKGVE